MRRLRYTVELPDGSHHEHAPVGYGEAEQLVRTREWTPVRGGTAAARDDAASSPDLGENGAAGGEPPFLLFLDEGESFFMLLPRDGGYEVSTRVADKWNLLGLMSRQRFFTLEFGLLDREDALALLKLFFEDNYPALRALNTEMGWGRNAAPGP